MNANGLQGEREAFEVAMRDRYNCTDHSFVRAPDGYVHAVGHRSMRMTYASVQMLWEAFQAGRASLSASTPPADKSRFKPGDVVRLTQNRDSRTAVVKATQGGGVCLETQLGGYFHWNELDLDHAAADNKENGNAAST